MAWGNSSDNGIRASGGTIGMLLVVGGALLALWMIHPKFSASLGR
ncbi:MAG TPA: hypothetical protein VGF92_05435 [Stellaceae bacterium]|jgi:hypothetical protein